MLSCGRKLGSNLTTVSLDHNSYIVMQAVLPVRGQSLQRLEASSDDIGVTATASPVLDIAALRSRLTVILTWR